MPYLYAPVGTSRCWPDEAASTKFRTYRDVLGQIRYLYSHDCRCLLKRCDLFVTVNASVPFSAGFELLVENKKPCRVQWAWRVLQIVCSLCSLNPDRQEFHRKSLIFCTRRFWMNLLGHSLDANDITKEIFFKRIIVCHLSGKSVY